jgi:hypothetical protein
MQTDRKCRFADVQGAGDFRSRLLVKINPPDNVGRCRGKKADHIPQARADGDIDLTVGTGRGICFL